MVVMLEGEMARTKRDHGGPRPGAGRPKSERDDISVKLDRTVVARARFVADLKGLTLAEYLTEMIRPGVDRDFDRAAARGQEGAK